MTATVVDQGAPPSTVSGWPPLRVLAHLLLAWRRVWRGTVFTGFAAPLLYLGAMGFGLGSLLSQRGQLVEGVEYVAFLAPGLLAATAMQTGVGESTWPVLSGIKWQRQYHAMLASPLKAGDVVTGHLLYVCCRLAVGAGVFLLVATLLGAVHSVWALLAVPVVLLVGLAHAGPVFAFSTLQENDSGFNWLFRFGVTPMFLFSGTFFPVSRLPDWLEPAAWVTPLWHGVELCRALLLGRPFEAIDLVHVGYLALWAVVGVLLARLGLRRRMVV
jgi:lipooligosaccharide transport system permease protein